MFSKKRKPVFGIGTYHGDYDRSRGMSPGRFGQDAPGDPPIRPKRKYGKKYNHPYFTDKFKCCQRNWKAYRNYQYKG